MLLPFLLQLQNMEDCFLAVSTEVFNCVFYLERIAARIRVAKGMPLAGA